MMAFFSLPLPLFFVFFNVLVNVYAIPLIYESESTNSNPYKVGYYDQVKDHFNDVSYPGKTFKQKYLYQDANWTKGGPVFFYTGNEGAIEAFWNSAGFVHYLAKEVNALVLFAEHRYYGASLPFGDSSFKPKSLGLLSIEQAMGDYAVLLTHFLKDRNSTESKVIAFGGSYGGMLAAYMRFKYPNLIHGALASSAPIYMQDPAFPRDWFFPAVTKDFNDTSFVCYTIVKMMFNTMDWISHTGPSGLKRLSEDYNLCETMKTIEDFHYFQGWLRNAFVMLSMLDYPYPTDFSGHLPANPVKASCNAMLSVHNPLIGLGLGAGVYYNQTKEKKCYDYKKEYIPCADPTGCGLGNDGIAWDYQACTEILLPASSNGITDMFPDIPFTPTMKAEYCLQKYGVYPPEDWPAIQFWGQNIKSASNIIFSNGDLDPWRFGGVLKGVSDSIAVIYMEGAAHHLDLRAPNPADPQSVTEARSKEIAIIKKWLTQ